MLVSLVLLTFFGLLTAYIAKQRGRDPVAWFMIGMFLGIFGPLLIMILPPVNPAKENVLTGTEESEDQKLGSFEFQTTSPLMKEWYLLDANAKQSGPHAFGHLKSMWDEGLLHSKSFVWTEGMGKWERLKEIPELESALTSPEPLLIEGI